MSKYGQYDIDKIAKQAKEQLDSQAKIVEPNDIYAKFRDDEDNEVPIDTKDEIKIKNIPDEEDYEDNFAINPEIDEFDTPIFPGGPLTSQVKSWKKQWDGYDIYAIEVASEYFVFRTLNRFEYKQIIALPNLDALQREEIICETCTLWPFPYKWDKMATGKAGTPSSYSQIIMQKSGFTQEYSIQIL